MIRQRPKNVQIKQKGKDTKMHYKHEHKDKKRQKMLKLVYLQRLNFKKRYFGNVDFETFSTCL